MVTFGPETFYVALISRGIGDLRSAEQLYRYTHFAAWVISGSQSQNIALISKNFQEQ
jgi:hypothetical protein